MDFRPAQQHYIYKPVGRFSEKVTKEEAQHVLMNVPDPIIAGRLYEWEVEHEGVGVYELSVSSKPKLAEEP